MNEANGGLTTREVQGLMDLRLDKAAEEIGYATGMLMMALLSNPPTRENKAGYADAVRELQAYQKRGDRQMWQIGHGQLRARGPLHVGFYPSPALACPTGIPRF